MRRAGLVTLAVVRTDIPRTRTVLLAAAACAALAVPALAVAPAAPAWAQGGCGPTGEAAPERAPWPPRQLDMPTVRPLSRGQGVVVAVIDSGVSPDHPVLRDRVLPGTDFGLPARSGHCDQDGHGTMVAGIIAGRDDTGGTFTGIAPAARVLPVRVLEESGTSTAEDLPARVAQGIRWAVENGADVINLSLETLPTRELADAVLFAVERDVVLVAAAGNVTDDEEAESAYPAAYQEVLAVAGVDADGAHVDTSVRGDYIAVAAPGADIAGPAPQGDGYRRLPGGGTSFAAAYVSGVVALVRSHHPDLSAAEVMRRVMLTADHPPSGRNDQVGYGMVNPYRAVSTVLGTRSNPPPVTVEPAPPAQDPLAAQKSAAGWVAIIGGAAAMTLLFGSRVVRSGRRRGWRPQRPGRTG